MRPLLLALVLGCGEEGDDPEGLDRTAEEFAPADGMMLEFVPPGDGDGEVRWIRIGASSWEVRDGPTWEDAAAVATWEVALDGGLVVDGAIALPESFREGASFDGGEVVALGERAVWYGLFPDVVTVELTGGPLAGEVAFAAGVGPIALADGWGWELASYAME